MEDSNTTYRITEKSDIYAQRHGEVVTCKSLTAAKRHATREQVFQDTVLVIEEEVFHGVFLTVASKECGERWVDALSAA